MKQTRVLIGLEEYPENGWAVILAGGSSSGKSTFIRDKERFPFVGEALSTDTLGENIVEVHNNAAKYAKEDPKRLKEAEKIVKAGCQSRYGSWRGHKGIVAPQNIHLDLDCKTWGIGNMSAVLSNGAHAQKRSFFVSSIKSASQRGKVNLVLDMTGKQAEVEDYAAVLHAEGYKVALVWVIASRTQAHIWNQLRPRVIKFGGVNTGHDNASKYLIEYLRSEQSSIFDDAWLVFNSTESPAREMTEAEKNESIVHLDTQDGHFTMSDDLARRIRSVIGPYTVASAGASEQPQWQMDETGKNPIIIDKQFIEKYTKEVSFEDGSVARALLQLRSSYKPDEGGLVVSDDKTGEPKLQKCNPDDTPSYPYVLITEADFGKKVQRRHSAMHRSKLKFEKADDPNAVKFCSDDWAYTIFARIRLLRKTARDLGKEEPRFEDIIVSFQEKDKKAVDANIKKAYKALGVNEPALPEKPEKAFPVNEPIREQFSKEEDYQEAVQLYPVLQEEYRKSLKAWSVYEECFK